MLVFLKHFLKFLASHLSSRQCHQRRSIICNKMKTFVASENDVALFVKQSDLLSLHDLTVS